ncbi:DASH complex subunit DAD2 [Aspergillus foveolatus]|uniref:DASH complex subunit DAD2 n=1 Tax=Aspergillus foveolatus TaxID=210207 RepID=UPI003CCD165B
MAYASRPTSILPPGPSTASLRQTNSAISQQQSSALAARVASKKAELDNLIQLRDMSNDLAGQMEALQAKLETLKDGTEAVACVLANWDNVLRAITMASTRLTTLKQVAGQDPTAAEKDNVSTDTPLPATLVRIPASR